MNIVKLRIVTTSLIICLGVWPPSGAIHVMSQKSWVIAYAHHFTLLEGAHRAPHWRHLVAWAAQNHRCARHAEPTALRGPGHEAMIKDSQDVVCTHPSSRIIKYSKILKKISDRIPWSLIKYGPTSRKHHKAPGIHDYHSRNSQFQWHLKLVH